MRISAILLAAGRGRRMGRDLNKMFLPVGGIPILSRAAAALGRVSQVDEMIVVAHADELAAAAEVLPPLDVPVRVVAGGTERQDSARAGLAAAQGEIVLVHDAARPFPSSELIVRVIEGTIEYGACIPAIPAVDTLRRVDQGGFAVPETLERAGLTRIQTPQGFRTSLLRKALAAWPAGVPLPDDAAAVLAYGARVRVVEGDARNIKVTTPADLEIADLMAGDPQDP